KKSIFFSFLNPSISICFLVLICNFAKIVFLLMEEINKVVHEAFGIIEKGGIILYPTDTVWGLGCDATNEEAVRRIYELKRREEQKSMIVLVNGDRLLYHTFSQIPEVAFDIWDSTDKPTTLILDSPKNVAKNLIAQDDSLGVRMVKKPFIFKLI